MKFVLTFLLFFLLGAACGKLGLPIIRRLQVGQTVRDDGPQSHLKKSGTPTFGGFFFILPLVAAAIAQLLLRPSSNRFALTVVMICLFSAVGFADDYIKVRIDRNGLSVWQKVLFLGVVSISFSLWMLWFSAEKAYILLPFGGGRLELSGCSAVLYLCFSVLFLFYISNSVNLADGVDGLCGSLSGGTAFFIGLAVYIRRDDIFQSDELMTISFAMMGAALSFLLYNRKPAKIFMGDTGSMALGAGLATISLLAGLPWFLLIAGVVFVAEGLSSLIQVAWFKISGGKRLFRMAPLHHHFELGGWSENRVVFSFSAVSVMAGILALLLL